MSGSGTTTRKISWTELDRGVLKSLSQIGRGGGVSRDTLSHYLTAMCQASNLPVVVDTFTRFRCLIGGRTRFVPVDVFQVMYEQVYAGRPSPLFKAMLKRAGIELVYPAEM